MEHVQPSRRESGCHNDRDGVSVNLKPGRLQQWRHRLLGIFNAWFPPAVRRRALLGAALAGIGILGLLMDNLRLRAAQEAMATVEVLTAARGLRAGHVLTPQDLASESIPSRWVHSQSVRAGERDVVLGRTLLTDIDAGEVLLYGVLESETRYERMAAWIRPGERAVALPADALSAVGYFIQPGDRVDVFLSTRRYGEHVVVPVLQNVAVLAVGSAIAGMGMPQQYDRVVVSVTPREAELLMLAQDTGRLRLLLRNADDRSADADFELLREADLFAGELPRQVQRQRNERVVHVIKGS